MMKVQTFVSPYEHAVEGNYTVYYREGVVRAVEQAGGSHIVVSASRHPKVMFLLCKVKASYLVRKAMGKLTPRGLELLDRLARTIGGPGPATMTAFQAGVGKLIFQTPGAGELKVFVDYMDSSDVMFPDALEWSDLYFKTSYGTDHPYPDKVAALPQCSFPLLGMIDRLRALRARPKKYDVCFATRVWGGTDEVEGIEHILRLLEAISKTKCKKFLRAYLIAGDKNSYAKRLDQMGIHWSLDPQRRSEYLEVLAGSRLNVHRLGMHNSITWRMSELLCMGACPVLDQAICTSWPEPLHEGVHYLHLDARPVPGQWVASDAQYAAIPERLEDLVAHPHDIERIALENRLYFDQHLEPITVGRHICEMVVRRYAALSRGGTALREQART